MVTHKVSKSHLVHEVTVNIVSKCQAQGLLITKAGINYCFNFLQKELCGYSSASIFLAV